MKLLSTNFQLQNNKEVFLRGDTRTLSVLHFLKESTVSQQKTQICLSIFERRPLIFFYLHLYQNDSHCSVSKIDLQYKKQSDLHNQESRIPLNHIEFNIFYNIFILQLCKNYVNLKYCIGLKSNVIVIKTAHRRSGMLKTLVSQEIFANIGLKKNLF